MVFTVIVILVIYGLIGLVVGVPLLVGNMWNELIVALVLLVIGAVLALSEAVGVPLINPTDGIMFVFENLFRF